MKAKWNWCRRVTDTSLEHLPPLSEENRMEENRMKEAGFFLHGRPQKEINSLTILSSAETAGGFLLGLFWANTWSICNSIGKKSVLSLLQHPRNTADVKWQQGTLLREVWACQSKNHLRKHLNKEGKCSSVKGWKIRPSQRYFKAHSVVWA